MDFLGNVAAANYNNSITPAEKQLRPILCDENIKVLSTFELNQVASLTYNDVTCDGIFEFIQQICSKPLDYTPLTLQKTLIVTKHIMVYRSEKTVSHAYSLQGCLQPLLEFNTVLMTQQQGGAMSFFQSLQGGAVDKGGPVREASREILMLLGNVHELRRLRVSSASEDSLVPVGDNGQAGFISDEVKLDVLKRRMAEEQRVRIQSNLKKSQGGFGGGYASKDGRSVVGAAHGIEEMIKMANKCGSKTSKFSDDGVPYQKTQEELILEELKMEADAEKAKRKATPTVDLLGVLPLPPRRKHLRLLLRTSTCWISVVDRPRPACWLWAIFLEEAQLRPIHLVWHRHTILQMHQQRQQQEIQQYTRLHPLQVSRRRACLTSRYKTIRLHPCQLPLTQIRP